MSTVDIFLRAGLLVWLGMSLLWILSLLLRDASIVDAFWGTGFSLLAILYAFLTGSFGPRSLLIVALTAIWGTRLSLHILLRRRGGREDPRYAAWRERAGNSFWWKSYLTVFMAQAVLMWLISAPLLAGQAGPQPAGLTLLDGLGAGVWAIGFLFEAVGDAQLARFRKDPSNRGKVLRTGLWAYTRHPNYFGDALVWWGLFVVAVSVPGAAWTAFSPLLMTFLLRRVSGVTLLEKGLLASKPDYAEYVERTSAFLPRPPSRSRE